MTDVQIAEETMPALGGLDELYVRHFPGAVQFAYLLTSRRDGAEDLAQEAFVRLAGRFRHVRNPAAFQSYLRRTMINIHFSWLRRLKLERAFLAREDRHPTTALPDVPARRDMWDLLETLPPRQRAGVVLRYYVDLSEAEAASELACSVAALKSLVSRALENLRGQLRGEEDE